MNAALIFILLIALMLTGMPISIALGLTVLTFLFTMTDVPVQAVALKLFTGIEKFEIMAIPFFILAGSSIGVVTRNGGCDRLDYLAGDGTAGVSKIIWCRCDHYFGCARHPDSTIDCDGDVFGINQYLGGQTFHGGCGTRIDAGISAWSDHLGTGT